jgi:hypothetical protein
MAKKKFKRAAKVAAGIGAAYLASQALSKKKPGKKTSSVARRKGDTFGADTAQDYAASRPRDTFESDTATNYENNPGTKFLSTPGGFSIGEKGSGTYDASMMPDMDRTQYSDFAGGAKKGKMISKMLGGGSVISRGNKLARSKPTKLF